VNDRAQPTAPKLREILEVFLRHRVDFVLVGGLAGMAHGSNYPSYDVDLAYDRSPENVDRLVAALTEIGVRLRGAPADLPFVLDARTVSNGANFTFITPYGDLDLLADVGGVRSYNELRSDAVMYEIEGFTIPVASIDHLIAMKRAANRAKDRIMLEEYIAIADEESNLDASS
jgi:predicted nucleotidyltransferase